MIEGPVSLVYYREEFMVKVKFVKVTKNNMPAHIKVAKQHLMALYSQKLQLPSAKVC